MGKGAFNMKQISGRKLSGRAGLLFLAVCAILSVACAKAQYRDGVYLGKSGVDDTGAWGEVEVTIQAGKIAACTFVTYQKDGTVKAEDYGKVNGEISNRAFYDKAQLAVEAMRTYAEALPVKQTPQAVDSIAGATIAYNQFNEAVLMALEKAAAQ
jgi:major membrane immunogen (membrane-anchored lipoprotein)